MFINYFNYQNSLFLVKDLISGKQDKNQKTVNNIHDGLIDLRNNINRKKIFEIENSKKLVHIIQKILAFNKQQKGKDFLRTQLTQLWVSNRKTCDSKCIKILFPRQLLQRLPIALAQVKRGNTSENVLNKI